jgi:hypothetical protein
MGRHAIEAGKFLKKKARSIFDKLRQYWKRISLFQKSVVVIAVLTFVAGVYLYYSIVSINVQNCEVCEPSDKYHVLKSQRDQKLAIVNIVSHSSQTLLSHTSKLGETVSIHFGKGRLDEMTLTNLKLFRQDVPDTPQSLSFSTHTNAKNSKTFIRISLRQSSALPNAIYLYPVSLPGDNQPNFKMVSEGLDLAIEIGQINAEERGSTSAVNELKIGNWHQNLSGIPITIIPEKKSTIGFRFDSATWDKDKDKDKDTEELLFKPFDFGNQDQGGVGVISASAVGTKALDKDDRFDRFFCGAPKDKTLFMEIWRLNEGECPSQEKTVQLRLSDLKVGKEHVQIAISGNAWALENGHPVVIDPIARLKQNPFIAALVGGCSALLLMQGVLKWIASAKDGFSGEK